MLHGVLDAQYVVGNEHNVVYPRNENDGEVRTNAYAVQMVEEPSQKHAPLHPERSREV